jgi:lipoate---protein ligase
MLCIYLEENDPFFCLAAEEFLLKNFSEDIFMLWQSNDTVVVGKHQNVLGEINYRYIRENGILVARRISGGGTVFNDSGNLNFSFIQNVNSPQEISFKKFTEPITNALKILKIPAETSGRNDLLVKGKKISGNAQHVFKNRVLHHGTLLFNSDLDKLRNALHIIPGKYAGKAVNSNRSEVANICDYLIVPLTLKEFILHLMNYQLLFRSDNHRFIIPPSDYDEINLLASQKFRTWDWQYGYSPEYTFSNSSEVDNRKLGINLTIKKGMIISANVSGTFYQRDRIPELENLLLNKPHMYETIAEVHEKLGIYPDTDLIYLYF